jgi:hypothetical protein
VAADFIQGVLICPDTENDAVVDSDADFSHVCVALHLVKPKRRVLRVFQEKE